MVRVRLLRIHNELDLLQSSENTFNSDPTEGGLPVGWHVRFFDESNWLQDICDIIESANFGLESFVINGFIISNKSSSFFQRDYCFPTHKQMDKLLTEVSKRLDFLVLWLPFTLLAHGSVLFIGGNFDKGVFRDFASTFSGDLVQTRLLFKLIRTLAYQIWILPWILLLWRFVVLKWSVYPHSLSSIAHI